MTKRDDFGGYGARARQFDAGSDSHSPWVWDELAERLKMHRTKARVLDVGCGTGISTRQGRRSGYPLIQGIDPDERMLTIAQEHGDIPYYCAPTSKMPFPNESFDAVVAIWSFNYFCDDLAAIKELQRVMRDGAVLMTVTWPLGELGVKRNKLIRRFTGERKQYPKGLPIAYQSYKKKLWECDFGHAETIEKDVAIEYTVDEAFAYMLKAPSLARVPKRDLGKVYRALYELCIRESKKGIVRRDIHVIVDITTWEIPGGL